MASVLTPRSFSLPTHDSDHRTLVVKLLTCVDVVKRYTRRRRWAPFRKVRKEEMTNGGENV